MLISHINAYSLNTEEFSETCPQLLNCIITLGAAKHLLWLQLLHTIHLGSQASFYFTLLLLHTPGTSERNCYSQFTATALVLFLNMSKHNSLLDCSDWYYYSSILKTSHYRKRQKFTSVACLKQRWSNSIPVVVLQEIQYKSSYLSTLKWLLAQQNEASSFWDGWPATLGHCSFLLSTT